MAHLAPTLTPRDRDGYRCLMEIQPDEYAILHLVSPPFLRLGTSQSGAILERRMPRERSPTQSIYMAIMGSKAEATSKMNRLFTAPSISEDGSEQPSEKLHLDHAVILQLLQFIVANPEQVPVDLGIVFADCRPGVINVA